MVFEVNLGGAQMNLLKAAPWNKEAMELMFCYFIIKNKLGSRLSFLDIMHSNNCSVLEQCIENKRKVKIVSNIFLVLNKIT